MLDMLLHLVAQDCHLVGSYQEMRLATEVASSGVVTITLVTWFVVGYVVIFICI